MAKIASLTLLTVLALLLPALALDHRDRDFDQLHLLLYVKPDIRAGTVEGEAALSFASLVSKLSVLRLHSKETKVLSVTDGEGRQLAFESGEEVLRITLASPMARGAEGKVVVRYRSKPTRGLYFHAPTKDHPFVPLSLYSQGEGADNRHWFPCYDLPDDRMTVELKIDVPDEQKTISNGLKVSEDYLPGPRRVDHWVFDKRLPSYLVTMIVGPYESWVTEHGDVILEITAFEGGLEEARNAFDRTGEMMDFFADYLDHPYPYTRYAQTFVWDFLYGGMENTTATTMNLRLSHPLTVRPNFNADSITAHELAHQWFGDLVTCRTFQHIWLNEGFATYLTDLFFEHAEGVDEFRMRRWRQNRDYLREAPKPEELGLETSPRGDIPVELFGGKAYNRGAAILNQLRFELGDEAFQKGVRLFLDRHDDSAVVSEDLRLAFEDAAGRDLTWFFTQWVYGAGYPVLGVTTEYLPFRQILRVTVRQEQAVKGGQGLFRVTVPIRVATADEAVEARLPVHLREHKFEIPVKSTPLHVRVNDGAFLLARVRHEQDLGALAHQAANSPDVAGRLDALLALTHRGGPGAEAVAIAVLEDAFYAVRVEAAKMLAGFPGSPVARDALIKAIEDDDPRVRAAAYEALGAFSRDDVGEAVASNVWREKHPYILAASARALGRLKTADAFEALTALLAVESHREVVRHGAIDGLAALGDPRAVDLARPFLDYAYGRGAMSMMRQAALNLILKLAPDAPETKATVLKLTRDPYFRMRGWAVQAIETYELRGVEARLKEMAASDPDGGVRWHAKKVLEGRPPAK
jgi:aminopeptidase N